MSHFDYDLLVLGGGSGGVAAARRAAEYGARVAVCEDNQWGGTCVNRGCVPKKLFVYSSEFGKATELMPAYGWRSEPTFHWPTLVENVTNELARLSGFYSSALSDNGVKTFEGKGTLTGPHRVQVNGETVTAERILLAVGGRPWVPDSIEGAEHAITSDDVFWLEDFPSKVLVVGSGYIGTEFACILNGLGAEVYQTFRSDLVLPDFDGDIRRSLCQEIEKQGVRFLPGNTPVRLEKSGDGMVDVEMRSGDRLRVNQVLMATGRTPRTDGIGLEEVGVELDSKGAVKVTDDGFQSTVPSIYAIGDCIRRWELTPVAIAEGRALAEHFFNEKPLDFSYICVATAVFSSPPAATVGYTEHYLRDLGCRFEVYRTSFRPMKYTMPDKQYKAMLKLLVNSDNGELLGCHMVGPDTPELIQVMAACMVAGATMHDLDRTFAVHPTLSEELVLFRKPTEVVEGTREAPDCRASVIPVRPRE